MIVPLIAAVIAVSGNGLRGTVQPAGIADHSGPVGTGILTSVRQGSGDVLNVGIVSTMDFIPLPPALLPDGPERWVMEQVYGPGLILPSLNGGVIQPESALIKSSGGFIEDVSNEFTFILRREITFHDETELTVHHVKDTYDLFKRLAILEHAEVDFAFAYIDTIVVDEGKNEITIRMLGRMKEQALRIAATAPIHPDFLDAAPETGDPWNDIMKVAEGVPLGLGAYNLFFDSERRIIQLLENRQYFGGRPNIRQISVHLYRNEQELRRAFITGEVQLVRLPTYKAWGNLMNEAAGSGLTDQTRMLNVRWYPRPNHFFYLAFNTTKEPLNIPEMRRALAFAIKRTDLEFRDEPPAWSRLADVPLHPDSRLGQKALRARKYSPRAAALRIIRGEPAINHTRAGYPRDERGEKYVLELIYPDHVSHYETLARRIGNNLVNMEFRIRVTPLSPQELRDRIYDGDYDLAISEMTLPPTVESILRLFLSWNAQNGLNFTRYVNQDFDTAVQSAVLILLGTQVEHNWGTYTNTFVDLLFREVPLLPLFFQANQYYFFNNLVLNYEFLGPNGGRLAPMGDWRWK